MRLSGWGRFPVLDCRLAAPRTEADIAQLIGDGPLIARGAGRAYGDSALNPHATVSMHRFHRMLAFDAGTGELTAEAGVMLADVIAVFLPRGWFPPVVPGTRFVTVGGMIAADVHGKNHHRAGSFGAHVRWLELMTASGAVVRCSPEQDAPLFRATVGGMGLTGVILRAAFRLLPVESAWMRQETVVAPGLDAVLAALDERESWTYSVAWIDCLAGGEALGRSLLYVGEHARLDELDADRRAAPFAAPRRQARRLPVDLPSWALNGLSVRAFNARYWRRGRRSPSGALVDWERYFFPLDGIADWNRIYGRRGFVQFQCVIPREAGRAGLAALLEATSAAGAGSFLAVLKLFGPPEAGVLSFPMRGYTLALDFPASPRTLQLVERLDRIAVDHGGRFYLAKDSRMSRATFEAADPRVAEFRRFRAETGAAARFASAQSERLGL